MKKLISLCMVLATSLCFSACGDMTTVSEKEPSSSTSISAESIEDTSPSNLTLVKSGYLGNYTQVCLGDVIDACGEEKDITAEWREFEAEKADGSTIEIVEFILTRFGTPIVCQLSVDRDAGTMEIVHFKLDEEASVDAYEVKQVIDEIYSIYNEISPESGLVIDTSTENISTSGTLGK